MPPSNSLPNKDVDCLTKGDLLAQIVCLDCQNFDRFPGQEGREILGSIVASSGDLWSTSPLDVMPV